MINKLRNIQLNMRKQKDPNAATLAIILADMNNLEKNAELKNTKLTEVDYTKVIIKNVKNINEELDFVKKSNNKNKQIQLESLLNILNEFIPDDATVDDVIGALVQAGIEKDLNPNMIRGMIMGRKHDIINTMLDGKSLNANIVGEAINKYIK